MSTQSSSNQISLHLPNPDKSLQFRPIEVSESDNLFHDHIKGEDENAEEVQMADHLRPMKELLQIHIVGIEDAIVVLVVLANEFELKTELLDFISNNPFSGLENDDPHSHIKRFYQITRTFKINQVPHDVVKLILFPFSLKGAVETWLKNEPPSGGNLMTRNTQEAFTTIENKAKVRTCRNKPQVSSSGGTSTQIDAITALTKQVEALEYHIASIYEPKATTSAPKKGTTYVGYTSQSTPMLKTTDNSSKKDNLSMSNSFSALNEEEEEDVENMYDESANLIQNTKAGGSSSFTAAAG
ncbi:hypothetical protein Tco_1180584 [Tanacetum coccineum]